MELGDLLVNRLVDKAVPQEPKKYAIQLQVRGPVPVCLFAVAVANVELGESSIIPGEGLLNVVESVFDKTDWLDITKEMPKDIAEAKMELASQFGMLGRMMGGCGKNFTLRLGKAD